MKFAITSLAALVISLTTGAAVVSAEPEAPTKEEQEEIKRKADETVAAAKRAGENAVKLAGLIRAGDEAAARAMIGQEINIGGKPTERTAQRWTMTSPHGVSVVATKLVGAHDEKVELENDLCVMWGKLKSVDVKNKTVTLEDVELIYVEKINWPAGK